MSKARLAISTIKIDALNNETDSLAPGINALERATYETYAKEEGKIIMSIETLECRIGILEQELIHFEQAEKSIQNDKILIEKYEKQLELIANALDKGQSTLVRLKGHQKRLSSIKPQLDKENIFVNTKQTSPYEQKLPPVKIPTFKGVRWEWKNFWTIFEEVIDKSRLSPLLKLNHLVNCLEGDAKELAGRHQLAEKNYEKVVNLLKERYDDKSATINELNQRLLEAEASDYKTPAQRKLWDEVRTVLDQLKGLDQDLENYMIKNMVIKKFNYAIQEEIYRAKLELGNDEKWTLGKISNDIEYVIKRYEYISNQIGRDAMKENEDSTDTEEESCSETTPKLKESGTEVDKKVECTLCEGPHYASHCEEVTDIEERIEILDQKEACRGCYRIPLENETHHCNPNYLCRNGCEDEHHYTLCQKTNSWNGQSEEADKNKQPMNHVHANVSYVGEESDSSRKKKAKIFESRDEDIYRVMAFNEQESHLATLKMEAFNQKTNKWDFISVLLDCGSSNSFISEDLRNDFNIHETSSGLVKIHALGNDHSKTKLCQRAKIKLKLRNRTVDVNTLVAEELVGTMSKATICKEDSFFILKKGLRLNDDALETTVRPKMILGADMICKVWRGNMIELPSGLTLLETELGCTTIGRTETERICQNDSIDIANIQNYADETGEDESLQPSLELEPPEHNGIMEDCNDVKSSINGTNLPISETPTNETQQPFKKLQTESRHHTGTFLNSERKDLRINEKYLLKFWKLLNNRMNKNDDIQSKSNLTIPSKLRISDCPGTRNRLKKIPGWARRYGWLENMQELYELSDNFLERMSQNKLLYTPQSRATIENFSLERLIRNQPKNDSNEERRQILTNAYKEVMDRKTPFTAMPGREPALATQRAHWNKKLELCATKLIIETNEVEGNNSREIDQQHLEQTEEQHSMKLERQIQAQCQTTTTQQRHVIRCRGTLARRE